MVTLLRELVHPQVPALFKNRPSYSLSINFSLLRPWQEYDELKNQREHSSETLEALA